MKTPLFSSSQNVHAMPGTPWRSRSSRASRSLFGTPRTPRRVAGRVRVRRKLRGTYRQRRRRFRKTRIPRTITVRTLFPEKFRTKMQTVMSYGKIVVDTGVTEYEGLAGKLLYINRAHDLSGDFLQHPHVENWVAYSSIYRRYLVHGVKVVATFDRNLSNNENAQFYSVFRVLRHDEAEPAGIDSALKWMQRMQAPKYRKKAITATGQNATWPSRYKTHKIFIGVRKAEDLAQLDEESFAGTVSSTGTGVAGTPVRAVKLWHNIMPFSSGAVVSGVDETTGFPGNTTYYVRYHVTFYITWFDRRDRFELAAEQTETPPE